MVITSKLLLTPVSLRSQQTDDEGIARGSRHALGVLVEASAVSENDLGAFLRKRGIHAAQLEEWRKLAVQSLAVSAKTKRPKASPEAKLVKALQRELYRKDKALAEVTALLALQKKLEVIWGDGGDPTHTKSGT